MITNFDITLSRINTPRLFRHTPFEHETTTDSSSMLTIAGVTIVTTQQHTNEGEGAAIVPSIPTLSPSEDR